MIRGVRRLLPFRACLSGLAALVAFGGCGDEPVRPSTPDGPPVGTRPPASQVLVVNTLSETLSRLEPGTGTLTVQAAVTGTWTNRIADALDGRVLLVTDSGSNEIALLDAGSLQRIGAIDVGPGRNPWLARALSTTEAVASNWLAGEVRVLDLSRREATTAVFTTPGPEGFVLIGRTAFVACTNYQGAQGTYGEGRVDVVDLDAGRVVASIPVGMNPQDVAVGPDGMVHVICTGDYAASTGGEADVVEPSLRMLLGTVPLAGAPGRLAAGSDGAMWVVGYSGGVQRYDPRSRVLLADPMDPDLDRPGLSAIAADPANDRLFVTAFEDDLLLAVDASTRRITGAWIVGDGPVDVIVTGGD